MANLKMMLLPMVKMVDQVNKLVQRQAIHLLTHTPTTCAADDSTL
jgi:hypothetical protein